MGRKLKYFTEQERKKAKKKQDKIWHSTVECGRNGYCQSQVGACCRGKRKTHKSYRWSYGEIKN